MAYCTTQDVADAVGGSDKLVELADYDRNQVADPAVVTAAIAAADAQINASANMRFAVPFNPVPDQIRYLSARLARYRLRGQRQMLTQSDQDEYERDEKWLEKLAEGRVLPGLEPIPAKSEITRDAATARPDGKAISRKKLRGFS